MKLAVLFAFCLLGLISCSTTQELKRERIRQEDMIRDYSPLTGYSYRIPPKRMPSDRETLEVPRGMVLSYSPLTGEVSFIPKNDGRMLPSAPRAINKQQVVSYSPLTGETKYIEHQGQKTDAEKIAAEFAEQG